MFSRNILFSFYINAYFSYETFLYHSHTMAFQIFYICQPSLTIHKLWQWRGVTKKVFSPSSERGKCLACFLSRNLRDVRTTFLLKMNNKEVCCWSLSSAAYITLIFAGVINNNLYYNKRNLTIVETTSRRQRDVTTCRRLYSDILWQYILCYLVIYLLALK